MSARFVRRLLVLVALLATRAALAEEPLPPGAVARIGTPGGTHNGLDYQPVLVSPDGELSGGEVVSPDGRLHASFSDKHYVRLTRPDREQVRELKGHTAYLAAVAFSPDGKTIASGSNDGTLRLWDTDSGKELHCCRGHDDQVCAVAFAPDGKTVASGSWDGSVRLWDVAAGKELRRLEGHRYEVRTVAFAPDGKSLASGGTDGTVRVWDAATGKELRRWTVRESGVKALTFAKGGKDLVVVDGTRQARLWDVANGKEAVWDRPKRVGELPPLIPGGPSRGSIHCAAFAPDGKTVALGHEDGTVRLYDSASGKELRLVGRHPGTVWSVAFSPDGKTLASSARRHGVVRLWDVATGNMVRSYPGHGGGVTRVLFTPDGKRLVAAGGSFDPSILVYDTATAKELRRLEGHTDYVDVIALAPDGKLLASGARDKTVRLWDLATGKERRQWAGAESYYVQAAFTADGAGLLAAGPMGAVRIFDLATGKERRSLAGVTRMVAASPDGRTLATATPDNFIALVEVATEQERRRFNDGGGVSNWMTFAPDGRRLLSDAGDGTAFLWDLTGGAKGGLTARARTDLWGDLAGADGSRAYDAVWKLTLSPRESFPLLREGLKPAAAVDATHVPRWIRELDDDDFAVREKATKGLEGVGEAARAALEKAVATTRSAEVKQRAESLLAKLDEGMPGAEEVRQLRALEVLEAVGTAEARQVIEGLAKGTPEARLTREAKATLARLRP